jgi:hypothetical protein
MEIKHKIFRWLNKANQKMKEYMPLLSMITFVGVIFAIINPFCMQANQNREFVSARIICGMTYGSDDVELRILLANNGSKNCIVSRIILYVPIDTTYGIYSPLDPTNRITNEKFKPFLLKAGELVQDNYYYKRIAMNSQVVGKKDFLDCNVYFIINDFRGNDISKYIPGLHYGINNEKITYMDISKATRLGVVPIINK